MRGVVELEGACEVHGVEEQKKLLEPSALFGMFGDSDRLDYDSSN